MREINDSVPFIVEGERDVEALRALGLRGEIFTINNGMSLFQFCEYYSGLYDRTIIFTDWDRKGRDLHDRLERDMYANGVENDDTYWLKVKNLTHKYISTVEELFGFYTWLLSSER